MAGLPAKIATWAILAALGYLLGCANGAILTSKIFYHDDVRKHGSGNAGLTNFYRTYGAKLVENLDLSKPALELAERNFSLRS